MKTTEVIRLTVFGFLTLAVIGCSREAEPPSDEIERALASSLPAFAHVSSFSVEATQNMGTKVEPLWQARFRSTVKITSATFASDGSEGQVIFLRAVKQGGESTELFGKSVSTLYAGKWRTSVEFEGQPIQGLGLPVSAFGSARLIIRGSKEEAAYLAEQIERQQQATMAAQRAAEAQRLADERANEERRKMLAEAPRLFVGSWRTQYGTMDLRAGGQVHSIISEYYGSRTKTSDGTWSVAGEVLTFDSGTKDEARWRVVRIDQESFQIQAQTSSSEIKATRIK